MKNLPKVVYPESASGSRTLDLRSRKSRALIITPPGRKWMSVVEQWTASVKLGRERQQAAWKF